MSVEIRTASITPVRQTFSHVARRLGSDKPASRYQEATFDLQSDCNFHYRPLWDAERELYDRRRTAVEMKDWYAFKDPRQFYYGAYVLNRSKLQETAEKNFEFVEKHAALAVLPKGLVRRIKAILLPLRHLEYAANLNNCHISAYGWGAAITQATTFAMVDRLAIGQYLTRIGLLIDGNTGESLKLAKDSWINDPTWQPLRKLAEQSLVVKDWFELFVAQNLVLDGLVYPLVYGRFGSELSQSGGSVVAMLTEFMDDWFAESVKWVDAFVKTAVAESPQNAALIAGWTHDWTERATQALAPLARLMYFEDAAPALDEARAKLAARLTKIGLAT
ncbi:Phenol hydroxylase P1 protein [Paraburkholderia caffeinitolerans]|uniref:Phenol hydroxylase P1 protein n=1 Tax=Paraburkholderia caffeinitolerans TaxID=1723730 RepID=A0A6J5FWJ3_9BURK|nr:MULTISPECIES: aromatic/alkene monooxygenase hydroxylase subunit beta [Paraburkholderia]CAB3788674.1 Phenol hydroxylase P1 protein [Paraburkholderia caffeinitolerans]